jgi:hypothetical protein
MGDPNPPGISKSKSPGFLRFGLAGMIASAALIASGWTFAQGGPEYVNREYRFMLNFPVAPIEEDGAYVSSDGTAHVSHVFSVDEDTSHYRMTVVRFSDEPANVEAEIDHAANLVRARGQVLHDQLASYDGVPGQELNLAGLEGQQIYANVLYHDRLLYIAEAEVSADAPPPVRFQTSVVILDAEGNPVCLSEDGLACLTIAN